MKAYVIILNYKNFQETISLVDQLLQQEKINLHIVVVDNCSPNESFQELKQIFKSTPLVEILQSQRNGGYSYGNNFGLRYIKKYNPENVFILNNDILINHNKTLLNSIIKEKQKIPKAILCAPEMKINGIAQNSAWKLPDYKDCLIMATRTGQAIFKPPLQYKFPKEKKTEIVECVAGSFFLADYKKFESVGFFDEDIFLFGEETIIGFKIRQSGGINLLCRQYYYDHLWSKSINTEVGKLKRIKLQLYAREVFMRKYKDYGWLGFSFLRLLHAFRIFEEKFRLHLIYLHIIGKK